MEREKDLILGPRIARSRPPAPQLIGVWLAKLPAPLADRLRGHVHPAGTQQFFHVAVTETKAAIEPDRRADDLTWESMMLVWMGRG
jgi:hypothetical protein